MVNDTVDFVDPEACTENQVNSFGFEESILVDDLNYEVNDLPLDEEIGLNIPDYFMVNPPVDFLDPEVCHENQVNGFDGFVVFEDPDVNDEIPVDVNGIDFYEDP